MILSHTTQADLNSFLKEIIYGFHVRNTGRRIATGVKFQILKIETRNDSSRGFATASDRVITLATYNHADKIRGDIQTTLVPNAATLVSLAFWREDRDAIFPSATYLPDYYEEGCADAIEYRFTVVAFADNANFATEVLTIDTRL